MMSFFVTKKQIPKAMTNSPGSCCPQLPPKTQHVPTTATTDKSAHERLKLKRAHALLNSEELPAFSAPRLGEDLRQHVDCFLFFPRHVRTRQQSAHFLNVSPKQAHDKARKAARKYCAFIPQNKGRKQTEEMWWLDEPVVCDGSMQEGGLKSV